MLLQKWDLRQLQPEDFEGTESRCNAINDDESSKFDKTLTMSGKLASMFRIFMEGDPCNEMLDKRNHTTAEITIKAATDGSCYNNGSELVITGAGVTFYGHEDLDTALRVPANLAQTNQVGELLATRTLAKKAPRNRNILDETDLKYMMNVLLGLRQCLENEGYIGILNASLIRDTVAALRERNTEVWF